MSEEKQPFRYLGKFIQCTQPVGSTDVGPGTEYPFEMTLEHAMYLYWKIYSFKISGAYTFNWKYVANVDPITVTNTSLIAGTFSPEFTTQWPQKMSEMVCVNPFFYGYGVVGSGQVTSTNGAFFPLSVTGQLTILYYKPILRTEEEDDFAAKYYIPFQCVVGLDDDYGGGVTTFLDPNSTGARAVKPGAFKLNIDGTTYTTSLTAVPSLGLIAYDLNFSGTLEMQEANARLAE